ncbi:MAG TPA: EamA family transporter [Mycobacteriales bacterium]
MLGVLGRLEVRGRLGAWPALGIVYVVWGSTYLAIKVSLETLPPLLSGAARFLAAAAVLGGVIGLVRPRAFRMRRQELATAAVVGLLLILGGNGFVVVAEQGISSGLAALLVSTTPLWLVVLRGGTGDRPSRLTVAGVAVGFLGVGVVLLAGGGPVGGDLPHALLVLGATLCWATGSLLATRRPMPANPFAASVVEMASGGLALLLLGTMAGELGRLDLGAVSGRSWGALAYLVVAGSVVAFSAFVWVLGRLPVSTVATYAYVNPVIALGLGALLLGEPIGGTVFLGGALIVTAVAVVVTAEGRQRRATEATAALGAAGPTPGAVPGGQDSSPADDRDPAVTGRGPAAGR